MNNKTGQDLKKIISSAEQIIKTAKKHSQNWRNISNFYGGKFHSEAVICKRYYETLQTKGFTNLKALKKNIDKFFNVSSTDQERREAKEFILKYYYENLSDSEPIVIITPTNSLFPVELFNNAPSYLKKIAAQAGICYDNACYDACSVMNRRILETLIIECFEKYHEADYIKNADGDFYYLADLINKFLQKNGVLWNASRNTKKGMPKLKSMGDKSAHSRRFNARKSDIEGNRDDFRDIIEELLDICEF